MSCGTCSKQIGRHEACYQVYKTRNWGGSNGPSVVFCCGCWSKLVGEEGRK